VASFWLQLGVDGFRVDAVPFLLETGGTTGDGKLDPHLMLKELRGIVSRRKGDAALLGETNLPPKALVKYFGDAPGDEIQLLFNFPVMQATYLALARREAAPLVKAFQRLPAIPSQCQWANFLRNHDELTLDQLSERERQEVFTAFGPEPGMQLFGRGLRRRLPPMLDGDAARLRLAYSLMLSLPGTPVLFYGEEIGMGENLAIPGRMSVRTPMQWTRGDSAGFSTARGSKLRRPIPEGRYGPLGVNVEDQRKEADSLLNWMERIIRRRRETPELGRGDFAVLDTGVPSLFAHRVDGDARTLVFVHNLAPEPCEIEVGVGLRREQLDQGLEVGDLLRGRDAVALDSRGRICMSVAPYGHHWLAIDAGGTQRAP
jgi:maltose alpha-D-glucosyltransferase/alpha-amylase